MKKYFITDELNETSKLIGPFNTQERVLDVSLKENLKRQLTNRKSFDIITLSTERR